MPGGRVAAVSVERMWGMGTSWGAGGGKGRVGGVNVEEEAEDEDERAVGLGERRGERGAVHAVFRVRGEGDALERERAVLAHARGGERDVGDVDEDEGFGVRRHGSARGVEVG